MACRKSTQTRRDYWHGRPRHYPRCAVTRALRSQHGSCQALRPVMSRAQQPSAYRRRDLSVCGEAQRRGGNEWQQHAWCARGWRYRVGPMDSSASLSAKSSVRSRWAALSNDGDGLAPPRAQTIKACSTCAVSFASAARFAGCVPFISVRSVMPRDEAGSIIRKRVGAMK